MTSMAALSAGVILLGGPTAAQTPPAPPRPSVITTPNWASIPSGEDMAAAYPEFANAIGQDGDVTLRCAALASGSLERCEIVETTPVGLGFDRAGLSLSSRFRVSPLQVDGEEAKSIVQFTIRFRARPFDPVLPWTGPEPDAAHLAATRTMIDGVSADVERDFQRSLQDLGDSGPGPSGVRGAPQGGGDPGDGPAGDATAAGGLPGRRRAAARAGRRVLHAGGRSVPGRLAGGDGADQGLVLRPVRLPCPGRAAGWFRAALIEGDFGAQAIAFDPRLQHRHDRQRLFRRDRVRPPAGQGRGDGGVVGGIVAARARRL